jgi:hypothetical protein
MNWVLVLAALGGNKVTRLSITTSSCMPQHPLFQRAKYTTPFKKRNQSGRKHTPPKIYPPGVDDLKSEGVVFLDWVLMLYCQKCKGVGVFLLGKLVW